MLILMGDVPDDDDESTTIKRIICVGLSRSNADVEISSFVRKRAHCKLESLIVETRGNC
jgi:hypothetical protein